MRSSAILFLAAALSLAAGPTRTAAQLREGSTTRISSGGKVSEGKLVRIGPDSLWLLRDGHTAGVGLVRTDSVWVRERNSSRGAVLGAANGAIILGALTGYAAHGLCEVNCKNSFAKGFFFGGLAGAGGGMVVGALLGSLAHQWKRVAP